ncbi:MAG: DNA topoisomerase 3 [Clostridium sp.]|nr:DNA topoisomerase 3 [Clostridium sp.]
MKLCITEKPSVARDIAGIIGATVRREGYYEGNGYKVTWTFGHLCTLKEPADYTPYWKRWSLGSLPMLPPRFGIKLIDNESYERQFHVIESLIGEAEEIINCGDAGLEGELIQRWVMQRASASCPVRRLWISSLTDEAIRAGFSQLRPSAEFDNLYYAGLSRSIGDWILGMNATRLYSLKYSEPGKVLSIGRVQTPTLALIVQRQREIDNFVPEDFWEVRTLYRDVVFNGQGMRFKTEAEAAEVVARAAAAPFRVDSVQQKKGKESPPRLFDLTSLQVEANKRWGWSADETLRLIQSLYEKKVTTYPRVDTTYLSEDIHKKIPTILGQMTPYAGLTAPLLSRPVPKPKRIFDNSKVTDHHAIIPTGQSPSVLIGNERQLYHLIALRFIAAFYPDCEFLSTTVDGSAADVRFRATGKVIEKPGWREVLFPAKPGQSAAAENEADEGDDKKEGNRVLPPFAVGEQGPHKPSTVKKVTQPPKPYTEGTLLRAMETAGRTVDDDELRDAMKENGIGRPSTRASIIETLFKRGYIRRERKNIVATEAGCTLIDTINEELLKSAKLTGLWENKLRRIERGEYSAVEFIDELKTLISQIVINVMSDRSQMKIRVEDPEPPKSPKSPKGEKKEGTERKKSDKPRAPRIKSIEEIPCPVCGKGHLIRGNTAYGCSRFREGCGLRLMFADYPADLTPARLRTAVFKAFRK